VDGFFSDKPGDRDHAAQGVHMAHGGFGVSLRRINDAGFDAVHGRAEAERPAFAQCDAQLLKKFQHVVSVLVKG
jgi:hypothetical protein